MRRGRPGLSDLSPWVSGRQWIELHLRRALGTLDGGTSTRRFNAQALWMVKLGTAIPGGFRRRHTYSWPPQAVNGLRNSSTTVVRRMLASMNFSSQIIPGGNRLQARRKG